MGDQVVALGNAIDDVEDDEILEAGMDFEAEFDVELDEADFDIEVEAEVEVEDEVEDEVDHNKGTAESGVPAQVSAPPARRSKKRTVHVGCRL